MTTEQQLISVLKELHDATLGTNFERLYQARADALEAIALAAAQPKPEPAWPDGYEEVTDPKAALGADWCYFYRRRGEKDWTRYRPTSFAGRTVAWLKDSVNEWRAARPIAKPEPQPEYVQWTFETAPLNIKARRKDTGALFHGITFPDGIRFYDHSSGSSVAVSFADALRDFEQINERGETQPCGQPKEGK